MAPPPGPLVEPPTQLLLLVLGPPQIPAIPRMDLTLSPPPGDFRRFDPSIKTLDRAQGHGHEEGGAGRGSFGFDFVASRNRHGISSPGSHFWGVPEFGL